MDDYPAKEDLEVIREWEYTGEKSIAEWFEYIRNLWHWDDYIRNKGRWWWLDTGGWSGNEEIIGAMEQNYMMWVLTWQASYRGGHYRFHVPKIRKGK